MEGKDASLQPSRRNFLKAAGAAMLGAAAATGSFSLAGCSSGTAANQAVAHVGAGVANWGTSVYGDVFPRDVRYIPVIDAPCETTRQGNVAFVAGEIPESSIRRTEETDVLVCGAGFTGVCAAVSASDDGETKVMCLEKMSEGRGIFEGCAVSGGKKMAEAGYELDKAEMMDRMRHAAYYRVPVGPIECWCDNSPAAADWLQDKFDEGEGKIETYFKRNNENAHNFQVPQTELAFRSELWSAQTTNNAGGAGIYIVRDLANTFKKRKNTDLRYNTPVVKLERNKDGRVTGAIAKDADGYFRVNASKGVILATGGFDNNPQMLKAWCRTEDIANTSSWVPTEGTTGDGQLMGLEIGGQMDPLPAAIMNFDFGNDESFYGRGTTGLVSQGLMINEKGQRFCSESLPFQARGNAISAQYHYGEKTYRVLSSNQYQMMKGAQAAAWSGIEDALANYKKKGYFFEADSIEELAEMIDVNPVNLKKTIERYNSFVDNGKDEDFNRPITPNLRKYEGDKWYAFKHQQTILATVSGLVVDYDLHVLDYDNEPIEGLYAAGGASGGFFSGNYPRHIFGPSAGRCMTFGYVSGRNAAKGV